MGPYQWFFLGLMVAWTPGLAILAFLLTRTGDPEEFTGEPEEFK